MLKILDYFQIYQPLFVFLIFLNLSVFSLVYFRKQGGSLKLLSISVLLWLILSPFLYPPLNFINLFLIGLLFVRSRGRIARKPFMAPKAVFEGGGIRRGLTAPEAAGLLGKSKALIITIALMQMLKKGFLEFSSSDYSVSLAQIMRKKKRNINYVDRENARREIAQELNVVLTPYEEILLEYLEQKKNISLNELNFNFFPSSLDL